MTERNSCNTIGHLHRLYPKSNNSLTLIKSVETIICKGLQWQSRMIMKMMNSIFLKCICLKLPLQRIATNKTILHPTIKISCFSNKVWRRQGEVLSRAWWVSITRMTMVRGFSSVDRADLHTFKRKESQAILANSNKLYQCLIIIKTKETTQI